MIMKMPEILFQFLGYFNRLGVLLKVLAKNCKKQHILKIKSGTMNTFNKFVEFLLPLFKLQTVSIGRASPAP